MPAKSFLTALLILAVWGCQSTPVERAPDIPVVAPDISDPDQLMQRAASASGRQADTLYLQAARLYFDNGQSAAARKALEAVEPDRLPEPPLAGYFLLQGQLAIIDQDLSRARSLLRAVDPALLTRPLDLDLAEAHLLAAEGRPGAAAASLMGAAVEADAAQQVNDAIWGYLNQLSPVQTTSVSQTADPDAAGWWALRQSMLDSLSTQDQLARLKAWRAARPEHPAARHLPSALTRLDETTWRPTRVGLLLPLSGSLARAGRAVRDGFIATYLRFGRDAGYDITLYDTASDSIGNLYEKALVDGMDMLVGPLRKESVAEMNSLNPDLPVLALNYLAEGSAAPNLVQLGLAIEDEAMSIASRLHRDGVQRLMLLHNDEDWAIRAARELQSHWHGPLTVQRVMDLKTITESVGAAMLVNASEQRKSDLAELLREDLEFLPRARTDVDAVVALVTNLEANALVPALHFNFARELPVYASSQSLRGAGPEDLRELNGFLVCELPWFVMEDETYRLMNQAFALAADPMSSLYALGVDAFRVGDRLPLFASGITTQLLGSTGGLRLGADGRFTRELAWGRVANRTLVPAPWSSSP